MARYLAVGDEAVASAIGVHSLGDLITAQVPSAGVGSGQRKSINEGEAADEDLARAVSGDNRCGVRG